MPLFPKRVILFSNCDVIRLAIDAMSAQTTRYQLVCHVRNVDDLAVKVAELGPDFVLFHTEVDVQSLREWRSRLVQARENGTKFVLLADHASDAGFVGAHQIGADAFVAVDQNIETFRTVFNRLSSGDVFWREEELEEARARSDTTWVREKLTNLEELDSEILALVVEGKSDKEIAAMVFMAHQTVRNHVSRLLASFGVRNRTELAVKCQKAFYGIGMNLALLPIETVALVSR
jgi:DNA-binding NarL/FixJ family response regulator